MVGGASPGQFGDAVGDNVDVAGVASAGRFGDVVGVVGGASSGQ